MRAWGLKNRHGGWMREIYLHHAQLGETAAKFALARARLDNPDFDWQLMLVEVSETRQIEIAEIDEEQIFFRAQIQSARERARSGNF